MALKATVYKAALSISDIDRGYYAGHELTLARHPSETETRLMLRLLAFAMFADERLEFGRGISTDEEPDLWHRDDTGVIERWIDLGMPDERRIRRATGRAREVVVIGYGERAFGVWWRKHEAVLRRVDRLVLWSIRDAEVDALATLARRNMTLNAVLQEGQVVLSDPATSLTVEPRRHIP